MENKNDYMENVNTIPELSKQINHLHNELIELIQDYRHDELTINMHPVLFITLIIFFSITISLIINATNQTFNQLHPRGFLKYWEYIILAILAFILFIFLANKSGFTIKQIV